MTDLPIIIIEAVYKLTIIILDYFQIIWPEYTISPVKAYSSMQFLLFALLTLAESEKEREREKESERDIYIYRENCHNI